MSDPLFLVGHFPPPVNGQTLATERLADLLGYGYAVRRVNTSAGAAGHVQADVRFSPAKVRHYLGLRKHIKTALARAPNAAVLWASISPAPLGHLRDILTVLPAFQPGRTVYAVVHWGDFDRVFRQPMTAVTAWQLVRRRLNFVFLSDFLAGRCARWIPDAQRFVIPNTIDAAVLCSDADVAAKRARRRNRPCFRLLYLSNMIASKGYLDALRAVHLLHARGVSLHADFVGGWTSDADRAAFEAFATAAGLREVITHHGPVSDRTRIKALHLDADAFLLPTYYPTEAQPLAVLEALNAGTPVVTTRHASLPEMVREGEEALFVSPRAPEAIADAVGYLTDEAVWRDFSYRARRRFEARFSPDAIRSLWEALIEKGSRRAQPGF